MRDIPACMPFTFENFYSTLTYFVHPACRYHREKNLASAFRKGILVEIDVIWIEG